MGATEEHKEKRSQKRVKYNFFPLICVSDVLMADTITDGFKNSSPGIPLLGGHPLPPGLDQQDCSKLLAEQVKVRETNGKILPS